MCSQCLSSRPSAQSKGFYVGVAFWPGHTVEEWGLRYNTTSLEFGLNPCNITYDSASDTSHRAYLVSVCTHVRPLRSMDSLIYCVSYNA